MHFSTGSSHPVSDVRCNQPENKSGLSANDPIAVIGRKVDFSVLVPCLTIDRVAVRAGGSLCAYLARFALDAVFRSVSFKFV